VIGIQPPVAPRVEQADELAKTRTISSRQQNIAHYVVSLNTAWIGRPNKDQIPIALGWISAFPNNAIHVMGKLIIERHSMGIDIGSICCNEIVIQVRAAADAFVVTGLIEHNEIISVERAGCG